MNAEQHKELLDQYISRGGNAKIAKACKVFSLERYANYRNLTTRNAFFSSKLLYDNEVASTLVSGGYFIYWAEKRNINDTEHRRMSGFPIDFDFCAANVHYVCGKSVPPLMIAKIAEQIKVQWLE